jgi:uncharacterized protein with ATP-grasp and redox domains
MRLFLDCLPCLLRQVLEAARMASPDEATQGRIMDEAMLTLSRHHSYGSAPAMAQAMHEIVKRQSGLADPYQDVKRRDMLAALRLEPTLRRFAESGPDALLSALKVSATGNVMDSALYSDLDIEACVTAELEKSFVWCDLGDFARDLETASSVLIIGDNAGEVVFDKVLARELAKKHEVTFAVRGQPIINDATADDARFVGIDAHATIVSTGCAAPGTILDACDDDFRTLFERVDLVISKGQGNFEALSDAPRPLYFLLKAKCSKIAHALNVDVGDYVFQAKA